MTKLTKENLNRKQHLIVQIAIVISIISLGFAIYTYSRQSEMIKSEVKNYVEQHKDELKGEKGDRGPVGPKGETGEQGPSGPAGSSSGGYNSGFSCHTYTLLDDHYTDCN